MTENDLQQAILDLAKPALVESSVSFESAAVAIQALFEQADLPSEIIAEIQQAYDALNERGQAPAVAVRSSANAEDLPDLSFAGQQDTYLNVRGLNALVLAIRRCWASLWNARALGYRHQMDFSHNAVAMAVVVQRMVEAEVSGILFTANPTTGDRSELVVNASYGLGEAIVGGEVTPDTYVLERDSLNVKETIIGAKEQMFVSSSGQGTTAEPVSEARREDSSLPAPILSELASMALKVEQHFEGVPQDIEWAVADGQLWLLQSRPVTNLPPAPLKDIHWALPEDMPEWGGVLARRKLSEHLPGPVSPLFEDVYVSRAINEASMRFMEGFGFDLTGYKGHFTINGYVYMTGGRPPLKPDLTETPPRRRNPPTPAQTVAQWRGQRVPDYLAVIEQWRNIDLGATSSEQLLEGVHALADADAEYWFEGFLPVMLITRGTDATFHGFLEKNAAGDGFTSGQFLTGLKSVAMEAEEELWAIAKLIRAEKALHDLVVATPVSRLLDTLSEHPGGAAIQEAIDRYLARYGHQIQTLDFCEPTAGEDPTLVLLNLKALVQNTDYNPASRQDNLAAKREDALRRADEYFKGFWVGKSGFSERSEEKGDSGELHDEFRKLLSDAKRFYPLREESLFYLGAGWPVLRRLALELGRRLVEVGTLALPDEVFYLTNAELEEAMSAQTEACAMPEYHRRAADGFELREARKRLRVPPQIPLPDMEAGQEEGQGMGGVRIKGGWVLGSVQMLNEAGSDTLEGFACSPGQVTAEASVILSPADFGKMKPGTILVCPMTTPAWAHLFSQAVGLVTDVGGVLSHGSIVAREYDIPAVLGTGDITQRIVSGQKIAVDGTKGTVTILSES